MENLKKYFATLKINLKVQYVYKIDRILFVLLMMLQNLVFILIWLAVYHFNKTNAINGFQISNLVVYFLIDAALVGLFYVFITDIISNAIHKGDVAKYFIRPVSFISQIFLEDVARITPYLIVGVLIIIFVITIAHLKITFFTALLFIIELIVAYAIITLVGLIIGSLSTYLTDVNGIANFIEWGFEFAGGAIIPLILFPKKIMEFLMVMPFSFLYYLPIATIIQSISTSTALWYLGIGMIWIAIFAILSIIMWKKMIKRINSVGI